MGLDHWLLSTAILHPKRERWRVETLQRIQIYCQETQTYPLLTRLLVEGLADWFAGNDVCSLNKLQFQSDWHGIIRKQAKVGWKQALLGRFVLEWSRIQGLYMDRVITQSGQDQASTKLKTPEQWQTGLITALWDQWRSLWGMRNQDVHGNDARATHCLEREAVQNQLKKIYSQQYVMDPKAQCLLLNSANDHDEHSLLVTKNGCEQMPQYLRKAFAELKRWHYKGFGLFVRTSDPERYHIPISRECKSVVVAATQTRVVVTCVSRVTHPYTGYSCSTLN